jgi:hypothetical protein
VTSQRQGSDSDDHAPHRAPSVCTRMGSAGGVVVARRGGLRAGGLVSRDERPAASMGGYLRGNPYRARLPGLGSGHARNCR